MRVIFMGTPEFAVPCLERIINDGHEVALVVTQPDKPKGRRMKLTPPPVKETAIKHGIEVVQPEKLKSGEFLADLDRVKPDIIIVVAYGKILPKYILDYPKYGCVNVHGSLLPKYRGAAPYQWAVINGEKVSGVTTMYMNEGLDTGDMILKKEVTISETDTAGDLHDKLMIAGSEALSETLKMIEQGTAPRERQDDSQATYAKMLSKEDGLINFINSAESIYNLIRGLCPWPVAYTTLNGKMLKVFEAVKGGKTSARSGEIISLNNGIEVACGDGRSIILTQIQAEGGRKMTSKEYLIGHTVKIGTILGV